MRTRMHYENYLYHHGIPGQKWGVRRYQNEDGSLTNAGKRRYGESGPVKGEKSGRRYAKDVQKTLNKFDQKRAKKDYKLESRGGRISRLDAKIEKRTARKHYNSANRIVARRDRILNRRILDIPARKSANSKKIIETYMNLASSQGFKVSQQPVQRVVKTEHYNNGERWIKDVIKRSGTLYKVSG